MSMPASIGRYTPAFNRQCNISARDDRDMSALTHPGRRSTLATRLRWAMRERDMTGSALAKAAGVKQPAIAQILSGRIKRTSYIGEIGIALQVSVYWLATGIGDPYTARNLSFSATQVAKRFDQLPHDAQREVISYMDFIMARMRDPALRELDPLEAVIQKATD